MITLRLKCNTIDGNTGTKTPDSHALVYVSDPAGVILTSAQGGAAVYTDASGSANLILTALPTAITVLRSNGTESRATAQKFITISSAWESRITELNRVTPTSNSGTDTSFNIGANQMLYSEPDKPLNFTIIAIAAITIGAVVAIIK